MNPPYRDNRLLVIYTVLTIHGLHYIFGNYIQSYSLKPLKSYKFAK